MKALIAPLAALVLGTAALPAFAGGLTFDLPRLTYPADPQPVDRDCTAAGSDVTAITSVTCVSTAG